MHWRCADNSNSREAFSKPRCSRRREDADSQTMDGARVRLLTSAATSSRYFQTRFQDCPVLEMGEAILPLLVEGESCLGVWQVFVEFFAGRHRSVRAARIAKRGDVRRQDHRLLCELLKVGFSFAARSIRSSMSHVLGNALAQSAAQKILSDPPPSNV